jgi:DNA-binding CsgD family transcriptional regulator
VVVGLIASRIMFGPSYEDGDPPNSSIADTVDGLLPHLHARDVTFLLVSQAPLEKLQAYKRRMGWSIPWVSAGDSHHSPSVTRNRDRACGGTDRRRPSARERLDGRTPREREVLELIARGFSNGEIAAALVIEESTVKTHVKRILMKLHLRDRAQAVSFAYESGLTQPGSKSVA